MASRQVTLAVNGVAIEMDDFVQGFIDHVVGGIVAALKGTGEIKSLNIAVDKGKVQMVLNNNQVPLNPFATKIISSTLGGMVSSLKGVGEIKQLNLSLKK